jgi:hypothetical protein
MSADRRDNFSARLNETACRLAWFAGRQDQFASRQNGCVGRQARRIEVANLTPGTTYNIRIRAIGGSTGQSDWSDVASRMSL